MCPSASSRIFGIFRYFLLVFIAILAIIFTYNRGVDFHIYIFLGIIISLLSGVYCSWNYYVTVEKQLLKLQMFAAIVMLTSNLMLRYNLPSELVISFAIIEFDALIFFVHRYIKISWQIKQNELLNHKTKGVGV